MRVKYDLVYNSFSFVIAAMGASLLFFLLARGSVAPRHRMAITLSTVVVGIALYHYVRIFNSWVDAFTYTGGAYIQDGIPFNEAYRYVDWLLTVPLLLAELVIVLKLDRGKTRSLLVRLTVAALAMIIAGYPGELAAADSTAKIVWGVVGTLPFLYILYVLFVELGNSLGRQAPGVIRLLEWTALDPGRDVERVSIAYFLPAVVDGTPVVAELARPGRVLGGGRPRQAAVRAAGPGDRPGEVPGRRVRRAGRPRCEDAARSAARLRARS